MLLPRANVGFSDALRQLGVQSTAAGQRWQMVTCRTLHHKTRLSWLAACSLPLDERTRVIQSRMRYFWVVLSSMSPLTRLKTACRLHDYPPKVANIERPWKRADCLASMTQHMTLSLEISQGTRRLSSYI